jgi:hypothetical protein
MMHLLLAFGSILPQTTWKPAPILTADNVEQVVARILPSAAERSWEEVAWNEDLGQAISESIKERRPILMWSMNGTPCGFT